MANRLTHERSPYVKQHADAVYRDGMLVPDALQSAARRWRKQRPSPVFGNESKRSVEPAGHSLV